MFRRARGVSLKLQQADLQCEVYSVLQNKVYLPSLRFKSRLDASAARPRIGWLPHRPDGCGYTNQPIPTLMLREFLTSRHLHSVSSTSIYRGEKK